MPYCHCLLTFRLLILLIYFQNKFLPFRFSSELLLFEARQAVIKQFKKGEDYHLLQPVYGLGLIATTFDPDPLHWYHHYQLVNKGKSPAEIIAHLQLVFIELPKFPIHSKNDSLILNDNTQGFFRVG